MRDFLTPTRGDDGSNTRRSPKRPGRRTAVAVRIRAVIGTLLVLLAVNGMLPFLGKTPLGGATAEAAVHPAPAAKTITGAAPGK